MSSNLVIVAIPARDDRIWKISSEKVPHLTLCFLGENTEDVPKVGRIVDFVEHCVESSEHGPFMLDVDERGTLGEDSADVVFFQKDYSFRWINQFRNHLLQQTDILEAYESVDQYPEWQPHLTLGYPETPADEDVITECRINWINFDRIAVWTGDYEGPEFNLRWPERELETALSMSISNEERKALGLDATIEHFGTLGMKWGTRRAKNAQKEADMFNRMADQAKDRGVGPAKGAAASEYRKQAAKSQATADKRFAKVDAKWEKNQFTLDKGIERHNAMADHFNKEIGPLNNKFKNDDFSKEPHEYPEHWSPRYKEYMGEVGKIEQAGFTKAVAQVHGTSPSGKKKMAVELDPDGQTLRMVVKNVEKVAHAVIEDSDEVFLFRVTRNAKGLITEVEPMGNTMTQTVQLGAEFIEHFGTKGMKWGVRKQEFLAKREAKRVSTEAANREKRPAQNVRVFPTIGVSKRQQGWVDTKGGEDHPPTEDAIKVAAARQKLKKSGVDALTNDELAEVAKRLNLEVQVDTLESKSGRKSLGRQFIESLARDKQTQRKVGDYALKTAFNTVA